MKLNVKDDVKEYEINLEPITQLGGQNIVKKSFILNSIRKYFSSEKYAEYEEHIKDNVFIDGELVGRKYFTVYSITDRTDLLAEIKNTKTSMLTQYMKNQISSYNSQSVIEQLDEILIRFFDVLNNNLKQDIGNICFEYQPNEIVDIVAKTTICSSDGVYVENKSTAELVGIFLNLLAKKSNEQPEKTIVILENIDHLISKDEYADLIDKIDQITEKYEIYFIITTSLDGYLYMRTNTLPGISVFNDMDFGFSDIERLSDFINKNYPYNKEWDNSDVLKILSKISQHIGAYASLYEVCDETVLKLMNQSLMLEESLKIKENPAEMSFLHARNMV